MRKTILALVALGALVLIAGCDPFGSDETKFYVRGEIFMDSMMTVPAEGVAVELLVDPDSSVCNSQTVFTNESGNFFMEVQMFPLVPQEEGGTGYTMPQNASVGLQAYYGNLSYIYKTASEGFIVAPGDTLTVWPVAVATFE